MIKFDLSCSKKANVFYDKKMLFIKTLYVCMNVCIIILLLISTSVFLFYKSFVVKKFTGKGKMSHWKFSCITSPVNLKDLTASTKQFVIHVGL